MELKERVTPTVSQLEQLANYINTNKGTGDNNVRAVSGSHIIFPEGKQVSSIFPKSILPQGNLILDRRGYGRYNPTASVDTLKYVTEEYNINVANDSRGHYWAKEKGKYLWIRGLGANLTASVEAVGSTAADAEMTKFVRCVRAK